MPRGIAGALLRQLHHDGLLVLVAMVAQDMGKIGAIGKLLVVRAYDAVAGLEAGLFRRAAFLHRANENTFTVLDAKIFPQLAAQVLGLDAQRGRVHVELKGKSGIIIKVESLRRARYARNDDLGTTLGEDLVAIAELYADLHGVAVAADAQVHAAARRHLAQKAAQLLFAVHGSPVELQDHIVLFQAGFAGRRVLVDHGDFHAALFLELQRPNPLGGDVLDVDPEV